ncbi:wax ester/triacylglycerol synthase family O-acyltransferase [Sansalvadorimonas sp. 2012CJ34-2]|uniref:diacylglycerol O-acyltransferase n=1 Tax=Parendozoicomonas callyspongiae TaxID=2942213 RepID=A0ABT0PK34_9GAMM|nr:wax ester/triacylglycerol synthase family O-acyltransferase [Sansalvadorimonas sp. 2012CJ34-2]MCL6271740.1 wax ester/triacylglycerol synthase family O-acyltransferase [Sansalvadorimonas sp. 2012CJ34-2]
MYQVSPQDNLFFHMESGTTPMHIGLLCLYNQSTAEDGKVRFKDIIKTFEARLHKVPALRNRAVSTPLHLDYPYWIVDPDFDIEYHIRHIALPTPGDWRQLCIQVARLHARPLDMNRPLWEATVIEGLDNIEGLPKACFAVQFKMHRAIYNREIGGQLMAALHDLGAESITSLPEHPTTVDRVPTSIELLSRAAINRVKIFSSYASVARRYAVPAARKLYDAACKSQSCAFTHSPHTRFNNKLSPHRVFEGTSFKLKQVNTIRSQHNDARFNDVVIAIIAGALHRYLSSKDELPIASMTAMYPVINQPEEGSGDRIHRFSHIFPRLYTEIADDKERLDKLIVHLEKARRQSIWLDWQFADDAARLFPNTLADLFIRGAVGYQNARHTGPFFNTFISSVAGPHIPLYHCGAKLESCFGIDSIYDNVGLAHNAFSYNGMLNITVNACRNMMPDPDFYIECINDSFKSLLKKERKTRRKISQKTITVDINQE